MRYTAVVAWFAIVASLAACGNGPSKAGSGGAPGSGGSAATGQTAKGGGAGTGGSKGSGGMDATTPGGTAGSGGRRSGATATGGRATGGRTPDAAQAGGGGAPMDAGARATGGATARGGGAGNTGGAGQAGNTGAGGKPKVAAAPGATLVKVDVATKYQTFEGWGTSLAWWAYQIGGWSSSKRDQLLDLIVNPETGLGYNVFRYNIGGGDAPSHDHMDENREMPGFQSASGTWDWNADARQTGVLTRLAATAKDLILEAFSNSPPYWMTKSGCASGSSDGSNNLKDDSYDAFASYLVEVTKHYRDTLGIAFRTLEPMNEPNANWWKANGGQEGCHFSASNQQQIIKAVAAALTKAGVTGTRVSASDENSMDDAVTIIGAYDTATLAAMDQMNVHSYSGSKRSQMRALATNKGKRLWQSETGPLNVDLATNTDAALFMAGRIIQDLRELRPEAWIEWQVVDPVASWSSFSVNDAQESWKPLKRFYSQAGFSRFIRPGATFVDVDNADMVAALARDGATLTIVARNGDRTSSKTFTFDLTSLPSLAGTSQAYRTSATEDLVHLTALPVQDWSFTATLPAYSVTTFVIALPAAHVSL